MGGPRNTATRDVLGVTREGGRGLGACVVYTLLGHDDHPVVLYEVALVIRRKGDSR